MTKQVTHFSYHKPFMKDWWFINMIIKPTPGSALEAWCKNRVERYTDIRVITDVEAYEKASDNFWDDSNWKELDNGWVTHINPASNDGSILAKQVNFDDYCVSELEAFPGTYQFSEYFEHNIIVTSVITSIEQLLEQEENEDPDWFFCQLTKRLITLSMYWH